MDQRAALFAELDLGRLGDRAARGEHTFFGEKVRFRCDDDAVARVRAPVGLDLGRVDQREIAVAILAELVALKAGGGLGSVGLAAAESASAAAAREEIDPVCGMVVDPATSRHRAEHDGGTVWFCSAGCQRQFEADPAKYA